MYQEGCSLKNVQCAPGILVSVPAVLNTETKGNYLARRAWLYHKTRPKRLLHAQKEPCDGIATFLFRFLVPMIRNSMTHASNPVLPFMISHTRVLLYR